MKGSLVGFWFLYMNTITATSILNKKCLNEKFKRSLGKGNK